MRLTVLEILSQGMIRGASFLFQRYTLETHAASHTDCCGNTLLCNMSHRASFFLKVCFSASFNIEWGLAS